MSDRYLLPCPFCGATLRVSRADAGARLACACGAEVAVPPLRRLQSLPPDRDESRPRAAPPRPWGLRERWTLVGGCLLAAGLAGVALLGRTAPEPPGVATILDARNPDDVSSYRLLETYQLWALLRQGPSTAMNRMAAYEFQRAHQAHRRLQTTAWSLAGIGLLVALAARCVLPRTTAAP